MTLETKNLAQIGNSKGVIIPRDVLEAMQVPSTAQYRLRVVGPRTLEIQFLDDKDLTVIQSILEFTSEYREDLRALARR
jgi:antitoxin component of MazEF toxin-antitoxin module